MPQMPASQFYQAPLKLLAAFAGFIALYKYCTIVYRSTGKHTALVVSRGRPTWGDLDKFGLGVLLSLFFQPRQSLHHIFFRDRLFPFSLFLKF